MSSMIKPTKSSSKIEWEEAGSFSSDTEMMTAEVDPLMMMSDGSNLERDESELPMDMSEWTAEEVAAYNALRSKRKKCCIGGCTHRSLPIAKSYHQLPVRNEEIWKKWVEIIRWSKNNPTWSPATDASPLVCSRHFSDTDFISYEASSRVRLSHTAIPVYYIDPPEGTEMDPGFSNPPPVPSISSMPRQKEVVPKTKKAKMEEYYADEELGNQYNPDNKYETNDDPSNFNYRDNVGYDIEEVNEESYEDYDNYEDQVMTAKPQPAINYTQIRHFQTPKPGPTSRFSGGSMKPIKTANNVRLSAPPTLVRHQINKNPVPHTTKSKLPALIKADSFQANKLMIQRQTNSTLTKPMVIEGGLKSILNKDFQSSMARPNGPKHKIGLAKCRLIIQTLQNQMRIAEMRLAEQLDIPIQVVRGVWNMRDSLKDKLGNQNSP